MFKTGLRKDCEFSSLNKIEFEKDYVSGMTIKKMIKKYGVTSASINNWRKALRVSLRKRLRPDVSRKLKNKNYFGENNPAYGYRKLSWLTKGVLKKLYVKHKTYRKIAKVVGCCPNTIKKMMFENNMMIKGGRKCKFSEELLRKLYFEKGMNIKQIGWCLGVDDGAVALTMRSYGIKYHSNMDWTRQIKRNWKSGQRKKIRSRDEFVCQVCGMTEKENGKKLSVHHIFYDLKFNEDKCLVSCCVSCHAVTNGNKSYWLDFFVKLLSEKYNYNYEDIFEKIKGGELQRIILAHEKCQ